MLQHRDAGGDRALGELQLAEVVLGQDDLARGARLAGSQHDHLALLASREDAIAQPGGQRVAPLDLDEAGPVDHAGVEQPGDEVEQPRAADAERVALADRVHAHVVVHRRAVDGAERAAHAVADLPALERGPGRRRAGHQAGRRAEQHLAVGADVHGDAQGVALVDVGRQCHRHGVGADEARHDGQQAHPRFRRDLQEQVLRGQRQRVAHHRRVGRQAHPRRIDAKQDVVHAGVADDHDLVDPLR